MRRETTSRKTTYRARKDALGGWEKELDKLRENKLPIAGITWELPVNGEIWPGAGAPGDDTVEYVARALWTHASGCTCAVGYSELLIFLQNVHG